MERTQLFELMGDLKLYGMKAAFDEIMATAVKRQHEPQRIVGDLLPHYGADCPVAVVFRASWPDQEKVLGTLADIAAKVQSKGIERTALIVVGRVLDAEGFADSSLYRKA